MATSQLPMSLALQAAWEYQLLTFPNPAVGAVCISSTGKIISIGAHKKAGGPHAEVYALRDAYTVLSGDDTIAHSDDSHAIHEYLLRHHNGLFHNVSMAVTLEPCSHTGKTPSCASLMSKMGLASVDIAFMDPNPDAANGRKILEDAKILCRCDVMKAKAQDLLDPFIRWQNGPFVFFKWAQRLDGTVDNGTISSVTSRQHMHALRDKCDLIVIGGNTVRMDRPTLDARLVDGKSPDVLIYSRSNDFDRTIPLFTVANRQVFIESTLDKINDYSLVMIEGGSGMMESVRMVIDWYLCYLAPRLGGGMHTLGELTEDFEVVHAKIEEDIILWMKQK